MGLYKNLRENQAPWISEQRHIRRVLFVVIGKGFAWVLNLDITPNHFHFEFKGAGHDFGHFYYLQCV